MIIIPARLKSTRFPNKILIPIGGIPMVIRVAQIAKEIDDVVIAADEKSIQEVCQKYHFQSILTQNTHNSGTDRIAECARILKLPPKELIINVQGDEPFLEVEVIATLKIKMQVVIPLATATSEIDYPIPIAIKAIAGVVPTYFQGTNTIDDNFVIPLI